MKRIVALLVVMVLLLAACQQEPPQPTPDDSVSGKPEGLFVFYNREEMMMGSSPVGLVSAEGEMVVAPIYDRLDVAPNFDWTEPDTFPAATRYFVASQFAQPEEDPWMENPDTAGPGGEDGVLDDPMTDDPVMDLIEEYDPWAWLDRQALISPKGEELTGFDYFNIQRAPGEEVRFVAQRADEPERFVWLDAQGEESDLDDPDLLLIARDRNRGYTDFSGAQPTGPDIPAQGLESVLTLPDGTFWGAHNQVFEPGQEPEGKGAYLPTYRYYSAGGELLGDHEYTYLEVLDGSHLLATIEHHENDEYYAEVYVTDLAGTPLTEKFESISHWEARPYLMATRKEYAALLAPDTIETLMSFDLGPDEYASASRAGDTVYLSVSKMIWDDNPESRKTPELYVLGRDDVLRFDDFPGYSVDHCNSDLTRFILSFYGGKGGAEVEDSVVLVDQEGNVLAKGFDSLYTVLGMPVSFRYDPQTGNEYRQLLDWDGNVLLGEEFSEIEVLPGNAALVIQGDSVGIVDFEGNWLYKQSVHTA